MPNGIPRASHTRCINVIDGGALQLVVLIHDAICESGRLQNVQGGFQCASHAVDLHHHLLDAAHRIRRQPSQHLQLQLEPQPCFVAVASLFKQSPELPHGFSGLEALNKWGS